MYNLIWIQISTAMSVYIVEDEMLTYSHYICTFV